MEFKSRRISLEEEITRASYRRCQRVRQTIGETKRGSVKEIHLTVYRVFTDIRLTNKLLKTSSLSLFSLCRAYTSVEQFKQ